MRLTIVLFLALSMAGCATTGDHPFLSWMFGRKARQEQKVEEREAHEIFRAHTPPRLHRHSCDAIPIGRLLAIFFIFAGFAESIVTQTLAWIVKPTYS